LPARQRHLGGGLVSAHGDSGVDVLGHQRLLRLQPERSDRYGTLCIGLGARRIVGVYATVVVRAF